MMMTRWMKWTLAAGVTAGWLGSAVGFFPAGPVRSEAMGNVFTTRDKPEFSLTEKGAQGYRAGRYEVKDFFGKSLMTGEWDGQQPLKFDQLGLGYYTLELAVDGKGVETISFAVVSDPATRKGSNGFFCIDTAHSWIGRTPPPEGRNSFRETARLAHLMGAAGSRDRLAWGEVAPTADKVDWKQYILCPEYMKEEGVEVLGMFHDAPAYVRLNTRSVPDDLFGLYEFCGKLGDDFGDRVDAWEFWNEQNATWFNWDAVWEMATAHKVAYLALKRANPEVKVLPGGLTEWIVSAPEYFDFLMANGLYDYFDAMAFHLYGPLESYSRFVGELNAVYAKHGKTPKPLWITESGTHSEGQALAQPLFTRSGEYDFTPQSAVFDQMEHSVGQEQVWAEFIVKSGVEMQMLGIAKNYPFVFLPYNEQGGKKAWGYFRWDYGVKPVYQANANQIEQTGAAELLGELHSAAGTKAYLYSQPDGTQTVVFWTAKGALDEHPDYFKYTPETLAAYVQYTGATPVEFAVADGSYERVDLMGARETVQAQDGVIKLTATKFPAYLHGVKGLTADIPAAQPGTPDAVQIDETVVLKLVTPQRDKIRNERFLFLTAGDAFTVEVYNFSDQPKKGKIFSGNAIDLEFPGGEITLAPMSKVEIPMIYRGSGSPERDAMLVIDGEFGGKSISPLAAPAVLTDFMERFFRVEKLAPERLAESSSGKIVKSVTGDTVRFDIDFTGVDDAWLYPVITLSEQERAGTLSAISFDIRAEQQEGSGYQYTFAIPRDAAGKDWRLEYAAPTDQWRNVFLQVDRSIPDHSGMDLNKVETLAIGMNPKAKKQGLEIRNVQLYFEK